MRPTEQSEPPEFGREVRCALFDAGFIDSLDLPPAEVEIVLARLYGYRLQTFRVRGPEITIAQFLTLIDAKSREAEREAAISWAKSPLLGSIEAWDL
jgi:hypothetical protein